MKYRRLGRTAFAVSDIAHGLWGMGGWSGSDDRESLEALQLSVDLGCNFFDTALAYGDGKSEDALLGEIISPQQGPKSALRRFQNSAEKSKMAGETRIQVSRRFSRRPRLPVRPNDP